MPWTTCQNLNHRRPNPPVPYCPDCGELVNGNLVLAKCSEEEHAKRRRARSKFCSNCGTQLIAG